MGQRLLAPSAHLRKEHANMTQDNGERHPGGGYERIDELAGDGVEIAYRLEDIPDVGTSHSLSYQGPDGTLTFTGTNLRFQPSEMGTLLSVTLNVNQGTGEEIKLTVLLPAVRHALGRVPIQTLAIRTNSRHPSSGPAEQVGGRVLTDRETTLAYFCSKIHVFLPVFPF